MSKAGRQIEHCAGSAEAGYTYAALLIVLVALALGVQAAGIPSSTASQRASEEELIHRGLSYARAVESYWTENPEEPALPPSLEALLDDPRKKGRRHIRRLLDPVIASEWRLLSSDIGGIAGVAPLSDAIAFKRANFPAGMTVEDGAIRYSDWEFRFDPDKATKD